MHILSKMSQFFDVVQFPTTEEEWLQIAENFETKWQLPHCCGAIDGKHVRIVKPKNSGSFYFNYKGYFSIVLLAVVDADCNFIYIDVGAQGRVSDGGIFQNSQLFNKLEADELKFPKPVLVNPDFGKPIPYYFVADDAFPLQTNIMKPYARRNLSKEEQIANYRISRGRRTVENAFGILANVFRVFHTPIYLEPAKAATVVRTACVLHNYMRQQQVTASTSRQALDTEILECDLTALKAVGRNTSCAAKTVRENLKEYFNSVGAVPWQDQQSTMF